jgi:starch-binding outer membrane protein, SusD/RagB family
MKMKHIISKSYKFLCFALPAIIIGSCSDDYLNFQPIAAESSASFYLTMAQAEQAVTAAYSTLVSRTAWDMSISIYLGDVTSNDCEAGGDYENEVPGIEELNRFTYLPTNGTISEAYGVLYRGIYFCNLAMEKIPNVLVVDPQANEAIINRRIGELKFLRALNYLYLTHIFGEVPFVDHVLTADEYFQPRAPLRKIFDLIEQDLKDAINILPERGALSSADIGRASKGAAKALLARMYLFESSYARYYDNDPRLVNLNERWSEVLDYCNQVIESEQYHLVGTEGETYPTWHGSKTDGFRYIFTVEGENSPETVFEIQYIQDGLGYTYTRAGSACQWVSPRYYINADGQSTNTPYWGLGWPTEALVSTFDPADPRLQTTVTSEGDSVEIGQGLRFPISFSNCPTGYYQNKYVLSAEQFADVTSHGWHKSPYNFKLIRYADVYLMAAEAALVLGQDEEALTDINAVRTRARMCGGPGNTSPANLTTISFQDIVDERQMELACEGRRFYDLVRWNLATELIGGTETSGGFPIQFESPKYDFMALPASEVTLSNGALEQYPGW